MRTKYLSHPRSGKRNQPKAMRGGPAGSSARRQSRDAGSARAYVPRDPGASPGTLYKLANEIGLSPEMTAGAIHRAAADIRDVSIDPDAVAWENDISTTKITALAVLAQADNISLTATTGTFVAFQADVSLGYDDYWVPDIEITLAGAPDEIAGKLFINNYRGEEVELALEGGKNVLPWGEYMGDAVFTVHCAQATDAAPISVQFSATGGRPILSELAASQL